MEAGAWKMEEGRVSGPGEIEASGRLLDEITAVVSAAAAAILAARTGGLAVRAKADRSPVTAADHAAEAVILEGLARLLPGTCVISEESVESAPAGPLSDPFVLVDPLDGTREFIAGRDEFTVNVALVAGGRPCLGVVAAPAHGRVWRGIEGAGAERLELAAGAPLAAARAHTPIRTRPCPSSGLVAAVSRSHLDAETEAFLARLPQARRFATGSSVKFCALAEGSADVYPRLSTTCEWDIAAGHAVLVAAGGVVRSPEGTALAYGRRDRDFRVGAFIAWGDPAAAEKLGLRRMG
jgi:3'(2'), 5'-bisphosphate nucleotidase